MKHPLFNCVLFKANRTLYKQVYRTMHNQQEYTSKGIPEYSLLEALQDYLLGRRYYAVLLMRPNIRVRGTKGNHPYETSSDIFFSEDEAWAYYEKMHDTRESATFRSIQIIKFRSKAKIPVWNMQRDNSCAQLI